MATKRRSGGNGVPSGIADETPVQDSWPDLTCYGCGPANPHGHHLHSYVSDDGESLVAVVDPDSRYNAGVPNVMYGGYIASLLDCHSMWTAMTFAARAEDAPLDSDPHIAYVTAELRIEYRRPTPLDRSVHLRAWVDGDTGRRMRIRSELGPEGEVTATGDVVAVRIV